MAPLDHDLRSLQEVRDLTQRAAVAQQEAATWDQAQTDAVCAAMVQAAARAAHDLARLAVEETGIGRVHYKVLKNLFASEGTWASIQDEATVGIVRKDERAGVLEVATPVGVIAGIVPTTNPTSTVINNALIAVKGRNAIVFSPHPRAKRCIAETVEVLRRAIERSGGPADLVSTLSLPTIEATGALMKHKLTSVILSTGGSGLVRAAYSSGKPAFGVGPGNVPVYIDRSAKIDDAARWIVDSQGFDNGTLCCSEQALVLDRPIADAMLAALEKRGAHLCCPEEVAKLERFCVKGGMMNADVVGQDPWKVAELAGFSVPRSTSVLLAPQGGVGKAHPLSGEVLCPLLSIHVVDGWEAGCDVSLSILRFGGLGHTIGLWANDDEVLNAWFLEKPASRIVVNGPTSQGAVGYSSSLMPAFSLGCGPAAGNITSDNISAGHMVNLKRVAFLRADFERRYEADMARAARFTGEDQPRGSVFSGRPGNGPRAALEPRPAPGGDAQGAPEVTSNWRGNPPSVMQGSQSAPPSGASAAVSAAAPRFTTPAAGSAPRASARPATPPVTAQVTAPATALATALAKPAMTKGATGAAGPRHGMGPGPYVGMALSPDEIQGILAHAGGGCPLGPCQGCPHHEVSTGACKA